MFGTVGNLLRLIRIAWLLIRYGVPGALDRTKSLPQFVARLLTWLEYSGLPDRPGLRLGAAFEALGPSFIKLGQALSMRADLLGDMIADDLARLQDRLHPFSTVEARLIIETELETPIEVLFAEFNPVSIAAGSIAQVHYALTSDGHPVAVKILRPQIEAQFARDFALFHFMAKILVWLVPKTAILRPRSVVRILEKSVAMEMDLRLEAAAAAELAENFADEALFRVPRIDWQRTARRVLTLERVEGHHSGDIAGITAAGQDPKIILETAVRVFFLQVFRDGFFHADLHPGNLFIASDGALQPVDFGIMGRLDKTSQRYLAEMLIGFLKGDYQRVAEIHFIAGYVPAHMDRAAFAQACCSIGEPIQGRPLHEISLGKLLGQLLRITRTFEMQTRPELLLLQKTMILAEGMGRRLDPRVNMWQLAEPLVAQWVAENLSPQARTKRAAQEILNALERAPRLIRRLEKTIEQFGQDDNLEPYQQGIRQVPFSVHLTWSLALILLLLILT